MGLILPDPPGGYDKDPLESLHKAEQELAAKVRRQAFEQAAGVLLGERGRLGKLQQKLGFSGTREAQMGKLYDMAKKLRKLK